MHVQCCSEFMNPPWKLVQIGGALDPCHNLFQLRFLAEEPKNQRLDSTEEQILMLIYVK